MKKNLYQWKETLANATTIGLQMRLADTLKNIALLESIYNIGAENNNYSKEFSDAAYNERQALCQLTSACYSLLEERGEPSKL